MERLYYCAGSTLVTGDDIAHALVDYARWIVARDEVDVVQVPTLRPDGALGRISILLSSTTQLSSETMASGSEELMDPDLVAQLQGATMRLSLPHPAVAEESTASLADAFDY